MKILITDGGEIVNQDSIRRIEVEAFDEFVDIAYFIKYYPEEYKCLSDTFCKSEDINNVFAEELFREILISECTKDVIDMREVKKLYKHREKTCINAGQKEYEF